MKKLNVFFPILVLILVACASSKKNEKSPVTTNSQKRVQLTESFRTDYGVTPATLKKLQYETGDDSLVLEKQITYKSATAGPGGSILLKNSEVTDRIVIPPHTPCICTNVDSTGKILTIVCGEDSKSFLLFGPSTEDSDKPYMVLNPKKDDMVQYGKTVYKITSGLTNGIFLNPQEIKDYSNSKTEKGRKVGQ